MEGITGAVFRRLHHTYFPGVDKYYTPFLSPTADRRFTPREQREFFPEHNEGIPVIPQILTKDPHDFLWAANELHHMGYEEIDLNLGCPSGTVTAKGKGAGMLSDLEKLDGFLDTIFSSAPCKISVKTRLGMDSPEEFDDILNIYARYPISELIVHPRIRKDFYRHPVRLDAFQAAYETYAGALTYNGSIVTPDDYEACIARFPNIQGVMIGQGLISDPFLAGKIKGQSIPDKDILKEFHDRSFDSYAQQFQSRNNAATRMKEVWRYLIKSFDHSDAYGKKLMRCRSAEEYLSITSSIFRELDLLEVSRGGW
ncbi:MAG: tRNA-dihydrouridine synthase family protein [Oscillospiraceae bacterium]|nr:tRNA-dihydrouridine synthase family protein [Oscillospiraceae bacterium]